VTVPDQPNKETKIPANDANSNKNANKPPDPPKTRGGVVLALYAGTVRSEGKTRSVTFRKDSGVDAVFLMLYLDGRDYQTYRADVVDQDGNVVYRSGMLKKGVKSIRGFSVPAQNLPNGDYMVRLSGIRPDGQSESAADYQFRVNRK
jgi:hypothetical protein